MNRSQIFAISPFLAAWPAGVAISAGVHGLVTYAVHVLPMSSRLAFSSGQSSCSKLKAAYSGTVADQWTIAFAPLGAPRLLFATSWLCGWPHCLPCNWSQNSGLPLLMGTSLSGSQCLQPHFTQETCCTFDLLRSCAVGFIFVSGKINPPDGVLIGRTNLVRIGCSINVNPSLPFLAASWELKTSLNPLCVIFYDLVFRGC